MAQVSTGGNAAAAREFAQADALERLGDLGGAEAAFRSLLGRYPNEPLLLGRLALILKSRNDLTEAERLLRRAIVLVPAEAAFHNNLGNVLRAGNRLPEAQASFRTAITLRPGYSEAHFNLGITLEELGQQAAAMEAIAEAVRLRADYHQAVTRLAALSYQQGELATALAHADAALAIKPDFFDALYYRGLILSAMERHDDALLVLEQAKLTRPESFEVALAIANNLQKADRNEEALSAFWALMEKVPGRIATHDDLNRLAWSTGRHDLFLRSFAYAREREGERADLLCAEGEFRFRRHEDEAAESLFRRAKTQAPAQTSISASLARTLARQGKYDECFDLLEVAIRGEPNNTLYRNDYGIAQLMAGNPRDALRCFEQTRVVAPYDQMALAGLCVALREIGDHRYFDLVDFDKYVRSYDIAAPAGHADARAFNGALAEELQKLHTFKVEPIEQTLRGGTQTSGLLFEKRSGIIGSVKERLAEAVSDYIRHLPRDPNHPTAARARDDFSFTHSWSCKLRSDGYHTNHVHPMGWISSAYYVSVPDEIEESRERAGWLKFGESNLALGEHDRPENAVKPAVGRLVLFPSFYWHGTFRFSSSRDRLTIAFDVVPGAAGPNATSRGPY